ncbi:hypothetical protein HNR21_002060 [Actinomadura cellulosilytica]|uniref:Uncharacterized protein n=1 Tax=Thermomonospora cellulosilytica TaxID=1411118 RepID=A0A7W3R7F3_9ACTN|nr:hypothetical protein [Thermomonospora cellulosilytica]
MPMGADDHGDGKDEERERSTRPAEDEDVRMSYDDAGPSATG